MPLLFLVDELIQICTCGRRNQASLNSVVRTLVTCTAPLGGTNRLGAPRFSAAFQQLLDLVNVHTL